MIIVSISVTTEQCFNQTELKDYRPGRPLAGSAHAHTLWLSLCHNSHVLVWLLLSLLHFGQVIYVEFQFQSNIAFTYIEDKSRLGYDMLMAWTCICSY